MREDAGVGADGYGDGKATNAACDGHGLPRAAVVAGAAAAAVASGAVAALGAVAAVGAAAAPTPPPRQGRGRRMCRRCQAFKPPRAHHCRCVDRGGDRSISRERRADRAARFGQFFNFANRGGSWGYTIEQKETQPHTTHDPPEGQFFGFTTSFCGPRRSESHFFVYQ